MLVLTRRRGEKVMVGEKVILAVLEIKGTRVRIGLDAPVNMTILRNEIQTPSAGSRLMCAPGVQDSVVCE